MKTPHSTKKLDSMKPKRLTSSLTFLIFLFIGLSIGYLVGQGKSDFEEAKPTAITANSTPDLAATPISASYKTVLFVFLDDLSKNAAAVEGIWLATSNSANTDVKFFPIYPALISSPHQEYLSPHDAVRINTKLPLNYSKLDLIASQKAVWEYSIAVDNIGLSALLHLANQTGQEIDLSGDMLAAHPKTWRAPLEALEYQWRLISTLCANIDQIKYQKTFEKVMSLHDTHIVSSMLPAEIVVAWKAFQQNDANPICIFSDKY